MLSFVRAMKIIPAEFEIFEYLTTVWIGRVLRVQKIISFLEGHSYWLATPQWSYVPRARVIKATLRKWHQDIHKKYAKHGRAGFFGLRYPEIIITSVVHGQWSSRIPGHAVSGQDNVSNHTHGAISSLKEHDHTPASPESIEIYLSCTKILKASNTNLSTSRCIRPEHYYLCDSWAERIDSNALTLPTYGMHYANP